MAAPLNRPGDSSSERPSPETSTRRLREQSQIEFEIDFLGRVLERDPFYVDALRVHGNNLAAKGQYGRALQIDRRLVRLIPDDAIAWYNLACSYAVLGMIEPAFSALQRSLELGYRFLKRLRRDPGSQSPAPRPAVCSIFSDAFRVSCYAERSTHDTSRMGARPAGEPDGSFALVREAQRRLGPGHGLGCAGSRDRGRGDDPLP